MELNSWKTLGGALLLAIVSASPLVAQNTRVDVAKRSRRIPKICELVTPAKIDGNSVDVHALVKEAICKGAGDMLADYTYTTNSVKHEKDKKGKVKNEETYVYDVFFPTLKTGTRTRGVQVVTSHNGVAVPPEKLEKARVEAAEKIEKEEARIANTKPQTPAPALDNTPGMLPLGMYTRTTVSRSSLGAKTAGMILDIARFLRTSDLTMARREQFAGRETLVFSFTPRPGTQFSDDEKYMAQLTGEIWIDAVDRIVSRLIAWPTNAMNASGGANQADAIDKAKVTASSGAPRSEMPPAVYVEMMRLSQQGVWLPHVRRINGADYKTLFDGIKTDSTSTYSNYIRFSTEVKDAEVKPPESPEDESATPLFRVVAQLR